MSTTPALVIDGDAVLPQFEPLADRVLVRRIEANAVSKGGLVIPPSAMEKLNQGEVLAAGPNVEDDRITAGAVVVFGKYAGDEIMLAEEVFVVIREVDVFGVVPTATDVRHGVGSDGGPLCGYAGSGPLMCAPGNYHRGWVTCPECALMLTTDTIESGGAT